MSETNSTTATNEIKVPSDSVCVLCATGTSAILGGQNFQTYSPDGAKKAATKLEKIHAEGNVNLARILALSAETRTAEDVTFLKEFGETPKPESLEIRVIKSLEFEKFLVPRAVVAQKAPLTEAQKAEKIARLRAQLTALETSQVSA
jgi:hypothetical protein